MTELVYIDTETTGLNPDLHEVWEIAYATSDGPVFSSAVPHSGVTADPLALAMNGYHDRAQPLGGSHFDWQVRQALTGNTLVAANPAFDAAFLRKRWGVAPWHYRMLDVEAFAAGILSYYRPKGLADIAVDLRSLGYDIPSPDHSAICDTVTLRACHQALITQQKTYRRSYVGSSVS